MMTPLGSVLCVEFRYSELRKNNSVNESFRNGFNRQTCNHLINHALHKHEYCIKILSDSNQTLTIQMGLASLSLLISFLIGGCSTYKIDETFSYPTTSQYRPTSRNSKSLFGSDNSREIAELRQATCHNCHIASYSNKSFQRQTRQVRGGVSAKVSDVF